MNPTIACERMNPPRRSQARAPTSARCPPAVEPDLAAHPGQEAVAVLDEQEREDEGEDQVDDAAGDRRQPGEHRAGDVRRLALQLADRTLDDRADLGLPQPERLRQPSLDGAEARTGARDELGNLRDHQGRDHRDHPADQPEGHQQHDHRREQRRHAVHPQPGGRGLQDRRDDQSEQYRQDDVPQLADDQADQRRAQRRQDEAGAPRRGPGEAVTDQAAPALPDRRGPAVSPGVRLRHVAQSLRPAPRARLLGGCPVLPARTRRAPPDSPGDARRRAAVDLAQSAMAFCRPSSSASRKSWVLR